MSDTGTGRARRRQTVLSLTLCALFAALTAVLSWAAIPMPWGVPYNLALIAVYLAGALLGAKRGLAAMLAYVLLGALGAPVFSGFGGGLARLLGMTGGYIAGYLPTALAVGLAADRWGRSAKVMMLVMAAATLLLVYLPGTLWFTVYSRGGYSFGAALMVCVVPYLAGDAAKIALSGALAGKLYGLLPALRSAR
ncbi:MAG: biotin transporter BioY [Oscillospiraceae bacterium]|nr:biotin transporter BioY [Oscillospiraceae bacterium]